MNRFTSGALAALAMVSLISGVSIAAPNADRESDARAIDEGSFIDVNGMQQWITVRGEDLSNPVLLILHGGPGIALSSIAPHFAEWEQHYTIIQWDQPRSGATALKNFNQPSGPLTVKRFTDDAITVAEHVRQRLGKPKMIVLGNSWGALVGLHIAKQRPDLVSAYVGTSQPVGGDAGKVGYDLALAAARARDDVKAVAALEQVGPPPHTRFDQFLVRQQYSNPPGLPASAAEEAAGAAMFKWFMTPPPAGARYVAPVAMPAGFNPETNFMSTVQEMFNIYQDFDAREVSLSFEVPVFIFQGEMDINTPVSLAREYLDDIKAPTKSFATIPGAGHNTLAFAPEVLALLNEHVRPVVTGK
jgi:pimeloyl-ACP methyl ester carboxylesterase